MFCNTRTERCDYLTGTCIPKEPTVLVLDQSELQLEPLPATSPYFYWNATTPEYQQQHRSSYPEKLAIFQSISRLYGVGIFDSFGYSKHRVEFARSVSKGLSGHIYRINIHMDDEVLRFVVKVEKRDELYDTEQSFRLRKQNEVYAQQVFRHKSKGHAPIVQSHKFFLKRNVLYSIITMKNISSNYRLYSELISQGLHSRNIEDVHRMVFSLFQDLRDTKFTHGDLHWNNLFYNLKSRDPRTFLVIDFEWSDPQQSNLELDMLSLMRNSHHSSIPINDQKALLSILYEIADRMSIQVPVGQPGSVIDRAYRKAVTAYRSKYNTKLNTELQRNAQN